MTINWISSSVRGAGNYWKSKKYQQNMRSNMPPKKIVAKIAPRITALRQIPERKSFKAYYEKSGAVYE